MTNVFVVRGQRGSPTKTGNRVKLLFGQPSSTSSLFIRALLTVILENGQLVVEFFSKISLSSRPMDGQQIITGFRL